VERVRRRGRSIGSNSAGGINRCTYRLPIAVSIDCPVSARVERANRKRRYHATVGTGFKYRAMAVEQDH
jgi:hypothetical protein